MYFTTKLKECETDPYYFQLIQNLKTNYLLFQNRFTNIKLFPSLNLDQTTFSDVIFYFQFRNWYKTHKDFGSILDKKAVQILFKNA